jgi:ferritin-like metal-binding protein YciE
MKYLMMFGRLLRRLYSEPHLHGLGLASGESGRAQLYRTDEHKKGHADMKENQLKELYVEELRDLYSAEKQLVKALPKMAKAATSPDLRGGFEEHLEQTKGHVARLEKIFQTLDESPNGKTCKGMEGLIKEGSEMVEEDPEAEQLDAGLISAAQRVEHYEIAGYGCVRTYAKLLGDNEAVSLLEETLNEEKKTDAKLTQFAEAINVEAMESGESEESEKEGAPQPRAKAKRKSASA